MTKTAIYVRLSQEDEDKTGENDDSQSIKNQKLMLVNYCMQHDWEVFDIYNDDDYKGSDRHRPAFNRLLKDAEDRKFDIVLCKTQSRFTRELELVEKYLHGLFPLWGIRFISIVDNADTLNKGNKKSRQINGLVNEWYLEDMSDNIRQTFRSKCNNGDHIGSFACYGYVKDEEVKGHLVIDEEAAQVVREIFELYASGLGQVKIAQCLNEKGIPNPSTYKRQKGLNYKNYQGLCKNSWSTTTIRDILHNEMYIGNMVQHRKECISYKNKKQRKLDKSQWIIKEQTHEPIIDMDLWKTVQLLLNKKTRSYKSGEKNKYAGIIKCMYCGSSMLTNTWRDKRYFRCRLKTQDKNGCKGSLIKESVLDNTVLSEFKKVANELLNKDFLEQQIIIKETAKSKVQKLENEKNQYNQKLAKIQKAIKNLYTDRINEIITQEDYVDFSKSFYEDRDRIKVAISDIDEKISQLLVSEGEEKSKIELIEMFIHTEKVTHEMVSYLIDKIEIGRAEDKNGKIPVKIYWKF